ncbi:hypothetical protein AGLY_006450 [Aphis glycines]|uniref:Uncharacterized protein n=1 Tax=Aphis glycines TaxID=307491 RepID=A0A6G0TR40_APHGL|nr:hypothetical protein AGLY_006450 [Aphis glycines]
MEVYYIMDNNEIVVNDKNVISMTFSFVQAAHILLPRDQYKKCTYKQQNTMIGILSMPHNSKPGFHRKPQSNILLKKKAINPMEHDLIFKYIIYYMNVKYAKRAETVHTCSLSACDGSAENKIWKDKRSEKNEIAKPLAQRSALTTLICGDVPKQTVLKCSFLLSSLSLFLVVLLIFLEKSKITAMKQQPRHTCPVNVFA